MTKNSGVPELKTGGQKLFVKMASEDGAFEGYASVFGVEDSYSDIVAPGAFQNSLAEHRENDTLPALLWQHDPGRPIGVYTDMREDDKGLSVSGQLALDTQLGREAHVLLKQGALNGLSIGFMTRKSEFDEESGIRTLTDIELWEVSLVTFPANSAARVEGVKAKQEILDLNSLKEVEKHLRDEGSYSQRNATAMVGKIREILERDRDDRGAKSTIHQSAKKLENLLRN